MNKLGTISLTRLSEAAGIPFPTLWRASVRGISPEVPTARGKGSEKTLDFEICLSLFLAVRLREFSSFEIDLKKLFDALYAKILDLGPKAVNRVIRIDHQKKEMTIETGDGIKTVLAVNSLLTGAFTLVPIAPLYEQILKYMEELEAEEPVAALAK